MPFPFSRLRGSRLAWPLFHVALLLLISQLLRVYLIWKHRTDTVLTSGETVRVLLTGLHLDIVTAFAVVTPVAMWCLFRKAPWSGKARKTLIGLTAFGWGLQSFLFVSEVFFFDEFLARFNTVAIDYLIYPTEVVTNIWESYPLVKIILLCLAGAAIFPWLGLKVAPPAVPEPVSGVPGAWKRLGRACLWPLGAGLMASTVLLADTHFSKERVVNELASNGAVSGLKAAWTRNLPYPAFYATLPMDEAWARARTLLGRPGEEFVSPPPPPAPAELTDAWLDAARASLQRRVAGDPSRPRLNVCVLLEESLGSEFFGCLGRKKKNGKPDTLTPRIDALVKEHGMLFDNLYADGNRTIRGFEGVFSSFPPLPGDSILARDRTEDVETLAKVLKRDGYQTLFLYGGHGTFDFIKSYTLPNGWDRLIEQPDFVDPIHTTAWGVCDEDLYKRSIEEMRELHKTGKPFFVSCMTVSNHLPFSYPTGRIPEDPGAKSRKHAVKYTDWAIGDFFERVQKEEYWKDTIFVMVADHGARVYGSQAIPLKSYEIPLYITGADVAPTPVRHSMPGCQLDVAPTILGLLGRPYETMFFGRDLLKTPDTTARAMLHHNRSIGTWRDERLVVFGLNKEIEYYSGDPKAGTLNPMDAPDALADEVAKDGISLFQVADLLYMNRRYRVVPTSTP